MVDPPILAPTRCQRGAPSLGCVATACRATRSSDARPDPAGLPTQQLDADEHGQWIQQSVPTVFATFEKDSDYFGSRDQQVMFNFRVRDLEAMLAQLRAHGATVTDEPQEMAGVGRVGWVTDPEGNRIELWQPA